MKIRDTGRRARVRLAGEPLSPIADSRPGHRTGWSEPAEASEGQRSSEAANEAQFLAAEADSIQLRYGVSASTNESSASRGMQLGRIVASCR